VFRAEPEELGSENSSGKESKEEVARDASVAEALIIWVLLHHLLLEVTKYLAKGDGALSHRICRTQTDRKGLLFKHQLLHTSGLKSTNIPKILEIVHSMYAKRTTLFASRSSLYKKVKSQESVCWFCLFSCAQFMHTPSPSALDQFHRICLA